MFPAIFFDRTNEKVFTLMSDDPESKKLERLCIPVAIKKIPRNILGAPVDVEILGYGNNGKVESLACRVRSTDSNMQNILAGMKRPIIPLSFQDDADIKEAPFLDFKWNKQPYKCRGFFGVYDEKTRKYIFE